jgi:hypothetical protein
VQVVDRKDRAKPYLMPCGRLAMAQTAFNPLEWDDYGKIGTWSRFFNWLRSKTGDLFLDNLLFLPIVAVVVPALILLRWMASKKLQEAAPLAEDDAEAALLDGEHADDAPEYEAVAADEKK